jgi:hypothetical protein
LTGRAGQTDARRACRSRNTGRASGPRGTGNARQTIAHEENGIIRSSNLGYSVMRYRNFDTPGRAVLTCRFHCDHWGDPGRARGTGNSGQAVLSVAHEEHQIFWVRFVCARKREHLLVGLATDDDHLDAAVLAVRPRGLDRNYDMVTQIRGIAVGTRALRLGFAPGEGRRW